MWSLSELETRSCFLHDHLICTFLACTVGLRQFHLTFCHFFKPYTKDLCQFILDTIFEISLFKNYHVPYATANAYVFECILM